MSTPRPTERTDAGSITVMMAVLVPALLLMVALVVDGAGQLRALSRADALAAEAARAAETALDTRGSTLTLDTHAAVAAARTYLDQTGHPGRVTITGPDTVTVSVTVTVPAVFGLTGPSHRATATASARLAVAEPPGAHP